MDGSRSDCELARAGGSKYTGSQHLIAAGKIQHAGMLGMRWLSQPAQHVPGLHRAAATHCRHPGPWSQPGLQGRW